MFSSSEINKLKDIKNQISTKNLEGAEYDLREFMINLYQRIEPRYKSFLVFLKRIKKLKFPENLE